MRQSKGSEARQITRRRRDKHAAPGEEQRFGVYPPFSSCKLVQFAPPRPTYTPYNRPFLIQLRGVLWESCAATIPNLWSRQKDVIPWAEAVAGLQPLPMHLPLLQELDPQVQEGPERAWAQLPQLCPLPRC